MQHQLGSIRPCEADGRLGKCGEHRQKLIRHRALCWRSLEGSNERHFPAQVPPEQKGVEMEGWMDAYMDGWVDEETKR